MNDIIMKTKTFLKKKETFEAKVKFLTDIIRLLCADHEDYDTVKEVFQILLDVWKDERKEIPIILPQYLRKEDRIVDMYYTSVRLIDDIYHVENLNEKLQYIRKCEENGTVQDESRESNR
jgi:hypothetical protein